MDTFGYTTIGSTANIIENIIRGSVFTCPKNGLGISITAYLQCTVEAKKAKCAIYRHSDSWLIASTEEKEIAIGFDNWQTFNFATSPSLAKGVDYVLVVWGESKGGILWLNRDISDATDKTHYRATTYNDWPNPAGFTQHYQVEHSIYCSYIAHSDSFGKILKQFKSIPTPIPRIEVDGQPEMIVDQLPVYRVDVFTLHWEPMKKGFKKVS